MFATKRKIVIFLKNIKFSELIEIINTCKIKI